MKRLMSTLGSLVVGTVILLGCSRERPVEFVQGHDANKVRISHWDNRSFPVETKEILKDVQTSHAERTDFQLPYRYNEDKNRYFHVNNMNLVHFESPATLLQKDLPFRGLPNKKDTYRICYEVTNTHLIVHKVAKPEFLPSQELTYKRVDVSCLRSGEVAITLAGFNIKLYRTEYVIDANGERTTRLMMIPVQEKQHATYMEFHPDSRQDFQAASNKLDVFPSNFLEGEWYYSEVFVKTNRRASQFLQQGGLNNPRHYGHNFSFEKISRVRFKKFKNVLKAFDANVVESDPSSSGGDGGDGGDDGDGGDGGDGDDGGDSSDGSASTGKEDKENLFTAIEIPVQWIDYRLKTVNGVPQLEEEELGDGHPEAREDFEERAYGKFDFIKMNRTLESIYKSTTMEEIQADENHFSFVLTTDLQDHGFISIRYSFKRAHPPKTPRYAKTNDDFLFGIFQTRKDYIRGSPDFYRVEDVEKTWMLNRFIFELGEKKEITFCFTPDSPEKWRDVGRRTVRAWDEAFEKADTGIRVVLKEKNEDGSSADIPLGDLRCNLINIVDHDKESDRLGGYGPSVVDTKSGEIVSATSNIYVPTMRDIFKRAVRKYLIYKLGGYNTSTFNEANPSALISYSPAPNALARNTLELYQESKELILRLTEEPDPILRESYKYRLDVLDGLLASEDRDILEKKLKEEQKWLQKEYQQSNQNRKNFENYPLLHADLIQRIEEICYNYPPEKKELEIGHFLSQMKEIKVNYVAAEIGKRKFIPTDDEIPVLRECAERLLPDTLTAIAIHEMGHNFAMRHNMAASSDTRNFTRPEDNEGKKVLSSSVMDYLPYFVQDLVKVGSYDIAYLRYLYANQVELVNEETGENKFIDLDPNFDDPTKTRGILEVVQDYESTGFKLREFRYCHTYDAWLRLKDPMCAMHDNGSTPLEVVQGLRNSYYAYIESNGQKLDYYSNAPGSEVTRETAPINKLRQNSELIFLKIMSFYQHWRYLLGKFVGEKDLYLDNFETQEELDAIIAEMANDETYKEDYELYYPASREAYKFFKDLFLNLNPRLCVVQKMTDTLVEEQPVEFLDFEKLKDDIFGDGDYNKKTIHDCDYSIAEAYLREKGYRVVGAVGHYFLNVETTMDLNKDTLNFIEITGLQGDKASMVKYLMGRPFPLYKPHRELEVSFLDEPGYRSELLNILWTRLLYGISTAQLGYPDAAEEFIPFFKLEKSILQSAFNSFKVGLTLPRGTNHTEDRKRYLPFIVRKWEKAKEPNDIPPEMRSAEKTETSVYDVRSVEWIYGALKSSTFAYYAVQERDRLYKAKEAMDLLKEGSSFSGDVLGNILDKDKILKLLNENNISGLNSDDLNKPFREILESKLINDARNIITLMNENLEWKQFIEEMFLYELVFYSRLPIWAEGGFDFDTMTPHAYLTTVIHQPIDPINFPTLEARVESFVEEKLSDLQVTEFDEDELMKLKEEFEENKEEKEAHLKLLTELLKAMERV